jgi:Cu/Ag efflux protein CusF
MHPIRSFVVATVAALALVAAPTLLPGATPVPTATAATGTATGTLANVDGSNMKVSVRAKDNTMSFLTVTESTVITRAGKPATLADLHTGDAVQANYTTSATGDQVATTLTVTTAKGKSGKGTKK